MTRKKEYDHALQLRVKQDDYDALAREAGRREKAAGVRVAVVDMVREAIAKWREWLSTR